MALLFLLVLVSLFNSEVFGFINTDPEVEQWEHGELHLRCNFSVQAERLTWAVIDESGPWGFVTKVLLENGEATSFDERFSVDMNGTMFMTNLTLLDGGRYVCQVTTPGGNLYESFTNVTVKPYVITDSTVVGWKGETITLPCNFSGFHVHAYWTKANDFYGSFYEYAPDYGSQSFQDDRIHTDEEYSLFIEDIKVSDEGTYICRVEHENDIVVDNFTSVVVNSMVGEHSIDQCTQNGSCEYEVTRGAIFILDCRVTGFKPNITLYWMMAGEMLTPYSDYLSLMDDGTNERMLSIEVDSDTGIGREFTCTASGDTALNGNSTVTVRIREARRFSASGMSGFMNIVLVFFLLMTFDTYYWFGDLDDRYVTVTVYRKIAITTSMVAFVALIAFLGLYFATDQVVAILVSLYMTCSLFLTTIATAKLFPRKQRNLKAHHKHYRIPWLCSVVVLNVVVPSLIGVDVIPVSRISIYAISTFISLVLTSLMWLAFVFVPLRMKKLYDRYFWGDYLDFIEEYPSSSVFTKIAVILGIGFIISQIAYQSVYLFTNQFEAVQILLFLTCSLFLTSAATFIFSPIYEKRIQVFKKAIGVLWFGVTVVLNAAAPLLIGVGVVQVPFLIIDGMSSFINLILPVLPFLVVQIFFLYVSWREKDKITVFLITAVVTSIGQFISMITYLCLYFTTNQLEVIFAFLYLTSSLLSTSFATLLYFTRVFYYFLPYTILVDFTEYMTDEDKKGARKIGISVLWFCTLGVLNVVVPALIGVGIMQDISVPMWISYGILLGPLALVFFRYPFVAFKVFVLKWWEETNLRRKIKGYEAGKAAHMQLPPDTKIIIKILGPVGCGKSAFIKSVNFALTGEYQTSCEERSEANSGPEERDKKAVLQLTKNIKLLEIPGHAGRHHLDSSCVTNIYQELRIPNNDSSGITHNAQQLELGADDEQTCLRSEFLRTINYPVFVNKYRMEALWNTSFSYYENVYSTYDAPHEDSSRLTRDTQRPDLGVDDILTTRLGNEALQTHDYPVTVHKYFEGTWQTRWNSFSHLAEEMNKVYNRSPMFLCTHNNSSKPEGEVKDRIWLFENYTEATQKPDRNKNIKLLKFIWKLLEDCDYIINQEVNGTTYVADDLRSKVKLRRKFPFIYREYNMYAETEL